MRLSEVRGETFVLRALAPKRMYGDIAEKTFDACRIFVFQVEKSNDEMEYVGAFCDRDSGHGDSDLYFATYMGLESDVAKLPRLGVVRFGEFSLL